MKPVKFLNVKNWSRRKALDWFFEFRSVFTARVVEASFYIFGIEVTWGKIRREEYDSRTHKNLEFTNHSDLDLLLNESRELLKGAQARNAGISDKCKTLLTLSSAVLAFVGIMMPKINIDSLWTKLLFVGAASPMLVAAYLFAVFFGVRTAMRVTVTQNNANLAGNDLKKSLINSYRQCATNQENQSDYLADVYRVARFFFLSSLMALMVLFALSFFLWKPDDQAHDVANQLHNNTNFLQNVRGERGIQGPKGDQGVPGPKGEKGDRGEYKSAESPNSK